MVTMPIGGAVVTKEESGMLQLANLKESNNCLSIALDGSQNGMIESVNNLKGGVSNCPNGKSILGIKQQFVRSPSHAVVILFEIYPDPGFMWINVFNQTWRGWKRVGG